MKKSLKSKDEFGREYTDIPPEDLSKLIMKEFEEHGSKKLIAQFKQFITKRRNLTFNTVNEIKPLNYNFKLKVTYQTKQGINPSMDKAIIDKINTIGGKWYAQGINLLRNLESKETNIRDICFDLKL